MSNLKTQESRSIESREVRVLGFGFRLIMVLLLTFTGLFGIAQTVPQKMNYQAVARTADGAVIANQEVGLRIVIVSSDALERAVYAEEHSVTTNKLGLINIHIGDGQVLEGGMQNIDWGSAAHYLRLFLEVDDSGRFEEMGTTQLLTVPYAFYSERSGSSDDGNSRDDPNDWTISGNTGTTAGTNFFGTTDAQDLVFKTNGTEAARFQTDGNLKLADGNEIRIGPNRGLASDANYNVSIGPLSGENLTSGKRNVSIGYRSGENNLNGYNNVSIGYLAGQENISGQSNTFLGYAAGQKTISANSNTFIGLKSGFRNTTGETNTFIGVLSGQRNTTGNNNVAIGLNAGETNTTGTSNTYIGTGADGSAALTNATAIGAGTQVTQSNSVVLGNNANVGIGTSAPAYTLDVKGDVAVTGKYVDSSGDAGSNGQVLSSTVTGTDWIDPNAAPAPSAFATSAGVTSNSPGATATDDLVFGATALDGTGSRMFFDKSKSAFRAGYTVSTEWDETSIGSSSFAAGNSSIASGQASTAFGSSWATGQQSFAAGFMSRASGPYSVAMGYSSVAQGDYATSMGWQSYASGDGSTALGGGMASGSSALALGGNADGLQSIAVGTGSYAQGARSAALTVGAALGDNSLAVGPGNTAYSFGEIALGMNGTSYTPTSTTAYSANDRLFSLGNGASPGSPKDAMVILKNGKIGIGTSSPASQLVVNGDASSTDNISEFVSNYSGNTHIRAITATAIPAAGYGYGVYATGGNRGVFGFNNGGSYIGSGQGVYGFSSGTAGIRYGVYGSASNSGGTMAVGIYGIASGATMNWAGYFDGRGYFGSNVGIGVSNPSYMLDVAGTVNATGGLYVNGVAMVGTRWDESSGDIYRATGNVGIGISNPTSPLQVGSNSTAYSVLISNSRSGASSGTGVYVAANGSGAGDRTAGEFYAYTGSGTNIGVKGSATGGTLNYGGYFIGKGYFSDNVGIANLTPAYALDVTGDVNFTGNLRKNGAVYTGSNWTVDQDNIYRTLGKVGVGTASPTYTLDVEGTTTRAMNVVSNYSGSSTAYGMRVKMSAGGGGTRYGVYGEAYGGSVGSVHGVLGYASTEGSGHVYAGYFTAGNATGGGTRYGVYSSAPDWGLYVVDGKSYFNEDGLMVGTTTPAAGYMVSVKGKIMCQELKVQSYASWPDYVFAKDYDLPSLKEVEDHISANSHLPGIPNAKTAMEEGIEVGQMQSLLLQKIEELTLYMIDANKQIQTSNERLNRLESENMALKERINELVEH